MPYFAVDDGFADHPKVVEMLDGKHGKGALALWTLAGSWSQRHATNGVVSRAAVKRLGGTEAEAQALVNATLWEPHASGYAFHDWDLHNGDGALVKRSTEADKRAQGRDRSQRFRDAHPGYESERRNAKRNADTVTESVTRNAENNAPVTTIPSHPIPSQEERETRALEQAPPEECETPLDGDRFRLRKHIESRFAALVTSATGYPPGKGAKYPEQIGKITAWVWDAAVARNVEELPLADKLLAGFMADADARAKGYPLGYLAQNPPQYLAAPKPVAKLEPVPQSRKVLNQ